MKALTVKQPFAHLICVGIKDIENRTWKCPEKYIGKRVLIHSSSKRSLDLFAINDEQHRDILHKQVVLKLSGRYSIDYSAIIGSARITGCTINHPSIWAEKTHVGNIGDVLDDLKLIGRVCAPKCTYNWVLKDAILFDKPALDIKGKLKFWESGFEILVCPKCGSYCLHENSDIGVAGWGNPVCECKCGYMIHESEFEFMR